eukprot:COSAG06_NODE_53966_length_297_cov_0.762626_1_plen_40_part_01
MLCLKVGRVGANAGAMGEWGAWRGGLPRCIALVSLVWKTL